MTVLEPHYKEFHHEPTFADAVRRFDQLAFTRATDRDMADGVMFADIHGETKLGAATVSPATSTGF